METRKYLAGQRRHGFWNWDWTVAEVRGDHRSNLLPWGGAKREQRSAFIKLDHVFANDWNLKLNYTRMRYTLKTDYTSIATTFDGDTQQAVHYLSSSWGDSKNWDEAFGADFTGDFELFGQEHKFVLGYNYQSNWSRSISVPGNAERRDNGTFYGYDWQDAANRVFVDFDNIDYAQYGRRAHLFDMHRLRIEKPRRQSGVYANLRLKLAEPLALAGGVRISRYQRDLDRPQQPQPYHRRLQTDQHRHSICGAQLRHQRAAHRAPQLRGNFPRTELLRCEWRFCRSADGREP